jgi:hypothetical protein
MSKRSATQTRPDISNVGRAHLLKAAAADHMHRFVTGTRHVTVAGVSEHLTVTGCFMAHAWGASIQLWARGRHGHTHAAAEASVTIDDAHGGYIAARISQFRIGSLLWTHTGDPVSQHPIRAGIDTFIAAAGDVVYQLEKEYDIDDDNPGWSLTSPGTNVDAAHFPDFIAAASHIMESIATGRR